MSSPSSAHLSPSSPPADLRHITSSGALTPQKDPHREHRLSSRASQHLGHRMGSLSPASIPSSPTSVHSSSSAIFERDIEPISPSPSQPHPNPHRIPRGKVTEQLDQAVPSVLDSAAAVLTATSTPSEDQSISVVAPAPMSSPLSLSRMSSRSPSPTGMQRSNASTAGSGPLSKIPSPSPSLSVPLPMTSGSPSSGPVQRPTVQTQPLPPSTASAATTSTGPQLPGAYISSTPTSSFSVTESPESSPTTTTRENAPTPDPLHISTGSMSPLTSAALGSTTSTTPPSPRTATHRLSFMSYTDMLSSTPSSTLPLSSLTTSASSSDPPPHLPSVLGIPQHQQHFPGSAAGSLHEGAASGGRNSWYASEGGGNRGSLFVDDVGGEWEREGLGQGLEERLEALMGVGVSPSPGSSPVPPPAPAPAAAGMSKA
ncbi:hypothetical protein EVG20_g8072 [Dentipellis fragilis]|uniref:Uncharacterized protein n=1 Tax=Dentipellis fragilis TaxID=205917 RepID=A0A4Y9YAP3_9AGAM|nr:hypothetical protein EVG20_g8072 [Dentipellis fragilis]